MKLSYHNFLLFIFLIIISCKSVDPVSFKTYVDTTTKSVLIQKKQTYTLNDLGIYASNEFDGARLNGLKKANDSTAILLINPENEPINKSAIMHLKFGQIQQSRFILLFNTQKGINIDIYLNLKKIEYIGYLLFGMRIIPMGKEKKMPTIKKRF